MPPKSKSKNAPNQHDKRHESGLAPPGKRVVKKYSNGHLNGQPNGKPNSPVPPSPLPSASLVPSSKAQRSADTLNPAEFLQDHAASPELPERDRFYSDVSLEEVGPCGEMADEHIEHAYIAPNAEALASAGKHANPTYTGNSSSSVSTLLAFYPLRDAISILILLLSLPPTLVLVIQTLFASLTFVPPTASISLSTLPNFKEIFNSSNFGYPALATILSVDLIFWVCWLPVWRPIQNIFLDLSQAVIAISLSGASASTGGPTYSIATCTAIVCVVHVLRYKAIHLTALDYLRSVLHKANIGVQVDFPVFATSFLSSSPVERGWIHTVMRTILGIHIVSQGVTTCIRRSLVKANEQSASVPAISKSDTEAVPVGDPVARSSSALLESLQHSVIGQGTDGRPPGHSPAHRDNRPRESFNKKKRKQANQVRSQQPLWAAIASTKVTFVKEMEQRDAFDDAHEAARMDTSTSRTPGISNQSTNRMWICEVRDTEILFSVELSPEIIVEGVDDPEEGDNIGPGIDRSKPLFVRINGATWSSAKIRQRLGKDGFASSTDRFDVEIIGLAPLSSYNCEIVSTGSHKILCSSSIITQPAPTAEQASSTPVQVTHQALRPSSPLTTLKQSVQQAEAKLHETRNRTRKNKKDQRAVHADIKREINLLRTKLDTSGGTDDKQERRLLQINQHKSQAEEAAAELKEQIEALGEIPEDEVTQSEGVRKKWQAASKARSAANSDFEKAKSEADRELHALKSDIIHTESKRDKLATRVSQRIQELETLASRQQADMTAKQRREFDRAQAMRKREEEERNFQSHIASLESEGHRVQQKSNEMQQEIVAVLKQPPTFPDYSSPPTPENVAAGINGSLPSPQANGFPPFGSQHFQSPFHSAQASLSHQQSAPRGRSSSMLSQYSGFTDNGEEYALNPEQPRPQLSWPVEGNASAGATTEESRETGGSGSGSLASGSTSSNSPHPDTKSYVKPIAPPSKNKNSPSQSSASTRVVGSGR